MSEPGFEELQRLWQSPSPALAPAQKIILRQHRRRWLSRLYLGSEIVITIVAIPVSIWLALQPRSLMFGLAALLFTLLAGAASLWARSVRAAPVEDPLLASVDEGVRRARIGVRIAYATLWILLACMVCIGALGLVWWSTPDLSTDAARRMVLALAVWFIWLAVWLAGVVVYLWARSRELAQMLLVREALHRPR
jgi:hypothetical protein